MSSSLLGQRQVLEFILSGVLEVIFFENNISTKLEKENHSKLFMDFYWSN